MNCGLVYVKKGFKPFRDYRRIERGRHKGQIEIKICKGSARGPKWVRRIVTPDQIKRYPKGE